MLFNSYIFLFLFLPLCLAGFYLLQNRSAALAKIWLTGFSFWFYGYFNPAYLLIMLCSILVNYVIHCLIVQVQHSPDTDSPKRTGRKLLILGITLNLLVLFYFKYFDFFLENVNMLFGSSIPLKHILLPLGISFFTFQQISFLVDTYHGELDRISPVDYSLFVSFFPQLIAGPIVVHEEMLPQFQRIGNDTRSAEEKMKLFNQGIFVFVLGFAKKVLIADTFGIAVDLAYSDVNALNGFESFLTVFFYALQLYFDFSGYCDMAKGLAGMFGMRIANNFSSPYKAVNIVDFWKRWHITLSRFFSKNIYIPLGGNRKGEARMYLNYLTVFFLSGLWHGAGWNYIVWGMMHGVLYVVTKWWLKQKTNFHVPQMTAAFCKGISCVLTFCYTSIALVFFRSASIGQGIRLLSSIFSKPWQLPGTGFTDAFNLGEFWYLLKILKVANLPYAQYYIMLLFTAVILLITFFGKNVDELAAKLKLTFICAALTAILFIWCVISLSGVSTFLYFNF